MRLDTRLRFCTGIKSTDNEKKYLPFEINQYSILSVGAMMHRQKQRTMTMTKKQKINTLDQAIKNTFDVRYSKRMTLEDRLKLDQAIELMCEVYRKINK
jgi:hypothetical protein